MDLTSLWISILVLVNMTQKNQEMIEQWFSQQGLFWGCIKINPSPWSEQIQVARLVSLRLSGLHGGVPFLDKLISSRAPLKECHFKGRVLSKKFVDLTRCNAPSLYLQICNRNYILRSPIKIRSSVLRTIRKKCNI